MGKCSILQFVKINEKMPVAGVGMGGNIFITLNCLLNLCDIGDRLYVDMETYKTIMNEPKLLFGTHNAWEYYFTQIEKCPKCLVTKNNLNCKPILNYYGKYTHNDPVCVRAKALFWDNFRLNDEIKSEIDFFYEKYMVNRKTLGVQVRLTDMANHHNVAKLGQYINKIKLILTDNPQIEQIFVATDDEKVISEFKKIFNIPIISQPDIYRANDSDLQLNPYDRLNDSRKNHNYLLGKEVLKDILLLCKCNMILKAHVSAVSQVSVILAENIEKTYIL